MFTESRKILFFSLSATLLTMAIVYYSFYTGRDIAKRYSPLVDAAMEMKLEATTAHLWFEKVISGDRTVDINEVWAYFDQSEWYAQAMLDGGTNEKGTFLALNDPYLRLQINETIESIHQFRQIALKRWASKSTSGIGSDINQQFDHAFLTFNLAVDYFETALQKVIAKKLQTFKFSQRLLLALIFMLGIAMGGLLLRYNNKKIKTNLALESSEKHLKKALKGSKQGWFEVNIETGEVKIDPWYSKLLGFDPSQFHSNIQEWQDNLHPDDYDAVMAMFRDCLNSNSAMSMEYRRRKEDGSWLWFHSSAEVSERGPQQQPLEMTGIHADITERKESEIKLKESELRLKEALWGTRAGTYEWFISTGEIVVNKLWADIIGYSLHELEPISVSTWYKLIHPDDAKHADKLITRCISQETDCYECEVRLRHKHGHWIWILNRGRVSEWSADGKAIRMSGTHQDITDRKQSELRDKSRTHVLELITNGEPLPVILEAIVHGVEQENPDMLCSIMMLDDEGKHLLNGAAPSLPDFYNTACDGLEIGFGAGSCGTAAFINERVIVDDIQNHPYWASDKNLASKAALGACWSEPIRSTEGKVLGTFAIYHHEVYQPTEANIVLIEQIASLASIAIEQTQAKLSLQSSEERWAFALEGAGDGVWDWNIETDQVIYSKRWVEMLGYVEDDIIPDYQEWVTRLHPEDEEMVTGTMQAYLEESISTYVVTYRLRCKDDSYKWILDRGMVVSSDSHNKPLRMVGTHTDVTELKHSEEKLKLAGKVFSHAREGIMITDNQGNIIEINNTFNEITGYSHEEVIGQNPSMLQSGQQSSEFYADMWQEINTTGQWYGEVWNQRKNGEVYPEILTICAVHNDAGELQNYIGMFGDISTMKENIQKLEHIANYDLLTNLPNRSLLADRLSQAMLQCSRYAQSLAVVFLDLDGFKAVNDTYGHDMGDELLIVLSVRMKEALREGDTLARFGGDEFVAVLADLDKVEDCEPILERLLQAASETVTIGDVVLNISASIGVTLYPQDNVDTDLLIRHADQAMYVAKESGKNRYHLFDTAQDDAVKVQRESLEAIRSALDNNQFVLHYQPKVNMRTGTVIGVEALIRWQHPERGLLNPIEFLPVIENNPMNIEMGEWVIDSALTQISRWQAMSANLPLSISVNIAAVQLQQSDFTQRLKTLLAAHSDVEPRHLELEVLETSALDDVHHVSTTMNSCMALGVKFALDDFGTGYSSLTYLRRLPANIIKIDQTFVRDMLIDIDDFSIVEGVIALAKSFKRDVIAEGVETIEHGTALLQIGCELAQGYGIARPMPASDIPEWINDWKPDVSWQS